MANILPFETQKKIWGMYRARFLIAASLVSLALSMLAMFTLVPSYLALQLAAPPVADTVTRSGGDAPADVAVVARTQALMAALTPVLAATTSPSEIILSALNVRPKGVGVSHITYTKEPALITFGGTAARAAISTYRDTLVQNGRFTNVSIPVDSLIGTSDSFTISLRGAL